MCLDVPNHILLRLKSCTFKSGLLLMHKTMQFAELFYPHDWHLLNLDLFTSFLDKLMNDIEPILFSYVKKGGLTVDILIIKA
jgi:hypothetical protein